MKKIITIIAVLMLSSCITEIDNGPKCEGQNGKIRDKCANVFSSNYDSDGKTFETMVLSHALGTGTYNLRINSTNGIFEEGLFTSGQNNFTASLRFSGKETQSSLIVGLKKIDRAKKQISGTFTFTGTFEENFQSTAIKITGKFTDVNF